jgi:hypothetical protein
VPVYGFGAKVDYREINSGNHTLHCFPLSGLKEEHDLVKLEGILAAYRACLPNLIFSGPTFLAPILKQSIAVCRAMKEEGREYMILMLVTDGDIEDFQEVADQVVEAGRLPLSIIIIGISQDKRERWPLMKKLDDNNLQLKDSLGRKSERDIVKFVEFIKHYHTPGELAKQVLEELPRQVEEYHRLEKIVPSDYERHKQVLDGEVARI